MFNIGNKHWIMAVDKPEDIDINQHVGKFVKVLDDNKKEHVVEIEKIMGNLRHSTKFEIVSKGKHYLISMLDFYAQINGESITPEEIALFDETMFEVQDNKFKNQLRKLWREKNLIDKKMKKKN